MIQLNFLLVAEALEIFELHIVKNAQNQPPTILKHCHFATSLSSKSEGA
jgi:hypothetical protein